MRLFKNIDKILTLQPAARKSGRGINEEDLGILSNAALIERDGKIVWVGEEKHLSAKEVSELTRGDSLEEVDLRRATVLPAFVECHTHSVFAGDRKNEFEMRNQGVDYAEISRRGGGILSTVNATRKASRSELIRFAQARVDRFVDQGVTCLEIKSGYGLSHDDELKMLEVAGSLSGAEIVSTYLGPHAIPKEKSVDDYFSEIIEKTLSEVAVKKLAERVDIFIENGFYSLEQARQFYEKAKELGFQITGHVEQLSNQKGSQLAVEMSALSVDHLVQVSESQIKILAQSNSTCVLLPGADFYLQMKYPPARALIEQGARTALATDFNPGSCPTQDLSFIGVLARLEMKMSLSEVIVAYTLNAAHALGRNSQRGSVDCGKHCDFIVLEDDYRDLFYQVGCHPVKNVFIQGQLVR